MKQEGNGILKKVWQCWSMPLHEKSSKGIVYVALYVDGNLM